ncbi:MAG: hypothetical protein ACKVOE_09640 [Rickettsiales bacterium]
MNTIIWGGIVLGAVALIWLVVRVSRRDKVTYPLASLPKKATEAGWEADMSQPRTRAMGLRDDVDAGRLHRADNPGDVDLMTAIAAGQIAAASLHPVQVEPLVPISADDAPAADKPVCAVDGNANDWVAGSGASQDQAPAATDNCAVTTNDIGATVSDSASMTTSFDSTS